MHSVSPKLYEMMRKNETMTLFPLPDPSTLRKRITSFVCAPGIQDECGNPWRSTYLYL